MMVSLWSLKLVVWARSRSKSSPLLKLQRNRHNRRTTLMRLRGMTRHYYRLSRFMKRRKRRSSTVRSEDFVSAPLTPCHVAHFGSIRLSDLMLRKTPVPSKSSKRAYRLKDNLVTFVFRYRPIGDFKSAYISMVYAG